MKPQDLTQITEMPEINKSTLGDQFVAFTLDRNDFALPAGIVDRIIRSVNITSVPGTLKNVLGVINVHGQALPVFDIRKIFNLPSRKILLSDLYILVRISGQTISIVVDSIKGITNRKDQKIIPANKIFPGLEKILEGLIFFEEGMILIYDPERLFTLENMGKIDIKVLEQKMKVIHETSEKITEKTPGYDITTVSGEEVKTKTGKIREKTDKLKKDASKRLKTPGAKKINEKQKRS
jgi:purine-binding chemotaxis protein CheW